uniref:KUN-3 n=1 Tax=Ixodes pacificus TaxID=29930 RepID=Q6B8G2_IXOPA|nr:KUN-3 [Ixodes pacificus]
MEIELLCTFFVLILGSSKCEGTGTLPEICMMEPNEELGRASIPGWFYDKSIDSCLFLTFGAARAKNEHVNRFETKKECSEMCRPHVQSFCFDGPPETCKGESTIMWSYNSTQGKCFKFNGNGNRYEGINVFDNEANCNKTCRDAAQQAFRVYRPLAFLRRLGSAETK